MLQKTEYPWLFGSVKLRKSIAQVSTSKAQSPNPKPYIPTNSKLVSPFITPKQDAAGFPNELHRKVGMTGWRSLRRQPFPLSHVGATCDLAARA